MAFISHTVKTLRTYGEMGAPMTVASPAEVANGLLQGSVGRCGQMHSPRLQAPACQLDVLAQLIEAIGKAEWDRDVVHSPLDPVELAQFRRPLLGGRSAPGGRLQAFQLTIPVVDAPPH